MRTVSQELLDCKTSACTRWNCTWLCMYIHATIVHDNIGTAVSGSSSFHLGVLESRMLANSLHGLL